MSVWRIQISLVTTAPIKVIDVITEYMAEVIGGNTNTIRIIPYPPNFSKIAARIIEPATGASTWALGSQRCTEKIGSFTRKAIINIKLAIKGFKSDGKYEKG